MPYVYQSVYFYLNDKNLFTLIVLPIPFPKIIIKFPLFAKNLLDKYSYTSNTRFI